MVGAKQLDHKQGIRNKELEADGQPQHLPTAGRALPREPRSGMSSGVRTTSSNDACKASSQRIAKRLRSKYQGLG